MKIFLAPGQGSQTTGFLTPWLEAFPGIKPRLEAFSDVVGMDLLEMGTAAAEEMIKDTAVAQPLIVGASLAIAREIPQLQSIDGFAGHSVGEFAACALAGVFTDQDAMRLVTVRSRAMAKAAALTATGMAAVIGTDSDLVAGVIDHAGLVIANYNGGGQYVAAGGIDAVQALVAARPDGVRVIQLKVAGAFHTEYMKLAETELAEVAATVKVNAPEKLLWSNHDGRVVTSGQQMLQSLVAQTSRPVRWDLCMEGFQLSGVNTAVELPPAGALSGLLKRATADIVPIALKNPNDVERI